MTLFDSPPTDGGVGQLRSGETNPVTASARTWVAGLRQERQRVDEVFLVLGAELRFTRAQAPYLALELGDRTGRIQARVWERAAELQDTVVAGAFVRVSGQVVVFNDSLQLNVDRVDPVGDESRVDLADFLPASRRQVEEMEREFREYAGRIASAPLRVLVVGFVDDAEVWKLFRQAPAAKMLHHAALGGLLEHTLSVTELCLRIAGHYSGAGLDPDLLLAAALLHDVGKTKELSWSRRFDYTDEGRLIGHIVLGTEMVTERARAVPDFAAETLMLLRHMLLSHHGQYEWGSPKRPKTTEALILHYADDLDGKVNAFRESAMAEEERDPDSHWTPYHRVFDRYLYRGGGRSGERGTRLAEGDQ